MCEKCNKDHQLGYHCPCECHLAWDRNIIEKRRVTEDKGK